MALVLASDHVFLVNLTVFCLRFGVTICQYLCANATGSIATSMSPLAAHVVQCHEEWYAEMLCHLMRQQIIPIYIRKGIQLVIYSKGHMKSICVAMC